MQNVETKSLEVIENKRFMRINTPKRISKIKDARRLLANLIYLFQSGEISSDYLKTLCYALIKYSELYKVETLEYLEERVMNLEESFKNENN
ncbi:hypothetical protein ACFLSS_03780 [Bacteroidota bacterium]